ncbi:MAG: hypothetical protein JJU20_07715 [Opitutales bacterium]|nr:hypothetical protein [Opitutales bacterium]
MSYHTTDAYGITRIAPSANALKQSIAQLPFADDEAFPEVSLHHENGHVLTYTLSRKLIWEDPQLGEKVRVVDDCDPDEVLKRWLMLAAGSVKKLEQCEWDQIEEW